MKGKDSSTHFPAVGCAGALGELVQSLNSPFFPPHIWGGKKGEFRDWTNSPSAPAQPTAGKCVDESFPFMADKLILNQLRHWIPNLSQHRFTEARRHCLVYGRGPQCQVPTPRMRVSIAQIDHFTAFITSPQVTLSAKKGTF